MRALTHLPDIGDDESSLGDEITFVNVVLHHSVGNSYTRTLINIYNNVDALEY